MNSKISCPHKIFNKLDKKCVFIFILIIKNMLIHIFQT